MTVTPLIAAEWLSKMDVTKQRSLRGKMVTRYAKAMALGHWVLTHQGIAFDERGHCIDGQHRLAAIIESGVAVDMSVTFGVVEKQRDINAFDAIDRGGARSTPEQLQVRYGIKDANRVAACCRVIASLCSGRGVSLTVPVALSVLDRFGDSVRFCLENNSLNSLKVSSMTGTLALCHRAMPNELDAFVKRVNDGDGIKSGQPAYALRNFVLMGAYSHCSGYLAGYEKATALACMHHVLGNSLKQVKSTMVGVDFFLNKQPRIVDEISALF
jgi:hypothetical protein